MTSNFALFKNICEKGFTQFLNQLSSVKIIGSPYKEWLEIK